MEMTTEYAYSIIIPTKNPGDHAPKLVRAIRSQSVDSCEYELIIIDSGSPRKQLDDFREAGARIVVVHPETFRHGRARNLGAYLAKAPILVFLTQDATPANESWLASLTEPLENDGVGGTYSRQIPRYEASPTEKAFLLDMYPSEVDNGINEQPLRIGAAHFSNVSSAMKKEVWQAIPFRETIIMGEDQNWAREAVERGISVRYIPQSCVIHSNNLELPDVFRRYFDSGISYAEIYTARNVRNELRAEVVFKGIRHIARQCRILSEMGKGSWIPYALLEDALKLLAILMGSSHRSLPKSLTRALSWHKHYFFKNHGLSDYP